MTLRCAAIALLTASLLPAVEVDPAGYRRHLEDLDRALAAGQTPAATPDLRVRWPDGAATPADPTIAALVAKQRISQARHRIAATLAGLDEASAPARVRAGAPLDDLRARVLPATPAAEGGLLTPDVDLLEVPESWTEWLRHGIAWCGDRIVDLWKALRDWWLGGKDSGKGGSYAGALWWVGGSIAAVVAVAVVLALRRRPLPPSAARLITTGPLRDEDPISRPTAEWIAQARRLTAEGRQREAARAWYHAVLTGAFAAGHLQHRTGRTNWEYLLALPPALPWHGTFASLTQRFDRVWYGGLATDEETTATADEAQALLTALGSAGRA